MSGPLALEKEVVFLTVALEGQHLCGPDVCPVGDHYYGLPHNITWSLRWLCTGVH